MGKLFTLDSIPLVTKEESAELFKSTFTEGTLHIMPKFGMFDIECDYDQDWLDSEDIEIYAGMVNDPDTEYLIELEIICKAWLCPGLTRVLFSTYGLIIEELHMLEELPEKYYRKGNRTTYAKATFKSILLQTTCKKTM